MVGTLFRLVGSVLGIILTLGLLVIILLIALIF